MWSSFFNSPLLLSHWVNKAVLTKTTASLQDDKWIYYQINLAIQLVLRKGEAEYKPIYLDDDKTKAIFNNLKRQENVIDKSPSEWRGKNV